MQTHVAHLGTTSCGPSEVLSEPLQRHDRLLENIGSLAGEQVLLLGRGALGLIDLLGSGAVRGVHLRSCQRLEPSSASLVIIQDVSSPASIAALLPAVHRALLPTGRLVICPSRNSVMLPPAIRRLLKRDGYARMRVIGDGECMVIKAERPAFGLRLAA
jgi:hypothetical protein